MKKIILFFFLLISYIDLKAINTNDCAIKGIDCQNIGSFCESEPQFIEVIAGQDYVTVDELILCGALLDYGDALTTPQFIKLNVSLIIDNNYTFYDGSIIYVLPSEVLGNTSISVNNGATLTIGNGSLIKGCESSWAGIIVYANSWLKMYNSFIQDATNAVILSNNSRVRILGNEFRRCSIGIWANGATIVNHIIMGNKFYGDEALYSPLSGIPSRGISVEGCTTLRMSDNEFYDYENTASTTYPIYLNTTSFLCKNIICDGFFNDGIYATDPNRRSTVTVSASDFSNFIGNRVISGSGINVTGCNLSVGENTDFTNLQRGILFLPKTNNNINVAGGTYTGIEFVGININNNPAANPPMTPKEIFGKIIDITVSCYDVCNGILIGGRRGDKDFRIENNTITYPVQNGININDCNKVNTIHNIIGGDEDNINGIIYNECERNFSYFNETDGLERGIWNTGTTQTYFECNLMENHGSGGYGFLGARIADANFFTFNQWNYNSTGIAYIASTGLPIQENRSNTWSSNSTNCSGDLVWIIFSGSNNGTKDPNSCTVSTNGVTDPTPSCSYTPYDPDFPDYEDVSPFLTPFLDDIVTASISYPLLHQGEQYDYRWYGFGVFFQYPELLENYSNAQDFFDALDTAKLGRLYAVYNGLNNLYVDIRVEKDTLELIMNRIKHRDSIILQLFDSIDIEVQTAKNDSFFHVIDSISADIAVIKHKADSVRDSIEIAVTNKISNLDNDLSSITLSDSIQIKIKQVLNIWIDRIEQDTLTTAQVASLGYIANQCYYEFGTAVRLARILYPVAEDYDEIECGESLILSNSDQSALEQIHIQPNPATDNMRILLTGFLNGNLSIVNIHGQKLMEQKITETKSEINFDVSNWNSGYYYLVINSTEKNKVSKFSILK